MRGLNLSYEKKKGLYGYGFIALWFVGALIFFIIPVIKSFIYSFYDVKPDVGQLIMSPLGLDNYKRAFMTDPDFRKNLVSVLGQTLWQTPIIIIFSLFVAIIINQKFKGRTFARAVFFLPVIIATGPVYAIITGNLDTSGTADADQFSTMFSADMVDELLEFVGILRLQRQAHGNAFDNDFGHPEPGMEVRYPDHHLPVSPPGYPHIC